MMFRLVDLVQGSPEWLVWRKSKTTATTPSVLLGESPYCTPNQLWRELALGEERQIFNPAVEKGKLLEEPARLWTERHLSQIIVPGKCVESVLNSRHAASLDGCLGLKEIERGVYVCDAVIEIKCPYTRESFEKQVASPPQMYIMQVMWQMYVTDVQLGYLVFFNGQKGRVFPISRDERLIQKMLAAVDKFQRCIDDFDEPPLCDRDWKVDTTPEWLEYADMKRQSIERLRQAKYEDEVLTAKLEQLAAGRTKIKSGGISYNQALCRGKVRYIDLLEELQIDKKLIESYRAPPIVKTTIKVC